jgi:hypothetical protein
MPSPAFIIATVTGIVPALIGMYYILRGFTGGFDDRKLFIAFAVGLIMGIVSFAFHIFIDRVIFPPAPLGWVIYVAGFSFMDNIMMFVVLNFKWMRGKPDAPFYGVSLGIAFSATATMALVYRLLSAYPELNSDAAGMLALVSTAGIAAILLRAATGAFIGVGSARSRPWPWFGRAVMTQMPFGTLFMLLYYAGPIFDVLYSIPILVAMVGYSYWLLNHVRKTSLPESLPGQIKRKIRRERRKGHRIR